MKIIKCLINPSKVIMWNVKKFECKNWVCWNQKKANFDKDAACARTHTCIHTQAPALTQVPLHGDRIIEMMTSWGERTCCLVTVWITKRRGIRVTSSVSPDTVQYLQGSKCRWHTGGPWWKLQNAQSSVCVCVCVHLCVTDLTPTLGLSAAGYYCPSCVCLFLQLA